MKSTNLTIQLASTGFQKFLFFNQFAIEVWEERLFCYIWLQHGATIEDAFAVSLSKRDVMEEKTKLKKYLEKLRTNPSPSVLCEDYKFAKPVGIEFPAPTIARTISCARADDDAEVAFHFYTLGARNMAAGQENASIDSCPMAVAVSTVQIHVDLLHSFVRAIETLTK